MRKPKKPRSTPLRTYHVAWYIDIEAQSPRAAAKKALQIQRDPDSWAVVFNIHGPSGLDTTVDLIAE